MRKPAHLISLASAATAAILLSGCGGSGDPKSAQDEKSRGDFAENRRPADASRPKPEQRADAPLTSYVAPSGHPEADGSTPTADGTPVTPVEPDQLFDIARQIRSLRAADRGRAGPIASRAIQGLFLISDDAPEGDAAVLTPQHVAVLADLMQAASDHDPDSVSDLLETLPEEFRDALLRERIQSEMLGDPGALRSWIDGLDNDLAEAARWQLTEILHSQHGRDAGFDHWVNLIGGHPRDLGQASHRFDMTEIRSQKADGRL